MSSLVKMDHLELDGHGKSLLCQMSLYLAGNALLRSERKFVRISLQAEESLM